MTPPTPEPIQPTPIFTSRLIQFFLGLFLLAALIHRQPDFSLFLLLLLGITFGAQLWSRFSLDRVEVAAALDRDKTFPGETVCLQTRVRNTKWLPVWVRVDLPADTLNRHGAGDQTPRETGLLWFQQVSFDWKFNPQQRGVYDLGPPRVTLGDLMGFYPREKKQGDAVQLIVFPRLVPLTTFSFPKRDYFGTPGAKSPVQDPVYVLGTRDYQSWRPARHIHWKASSRRNRLQEKIFEPSEQAKILLMVEVALFEKHQARTAFEHTLEVVASLAVRMNRQGYALGFVTDGVIQGTPPGIAPMARTFRQLSSILEMLARLDMKSSRPITGLFTRGVPLASGVSCLRFAYRSDPADDMIRARLRRREIPFVSFVVDTEETPEHHPAGYGEPVYRVADVRVAGTTKP